MTVTPLLTMREVAARLGSTPRAALHYIHRKRDPLPAIRLGERGAYRVHPAALDAWLDRQAVTE